MIFYFAGRDFRFFCLPLSLSAAFGRPRVLMETTLQNWLDVALAHLGLSSSQADWIDNWVILLLIFLIAFAIYRLGRSVIIPIVRRIVQKTPVAWDDIVFDELVMRRFCLMIFWMMVYILFPVAFSVQTTWVRFALRLLEIALVITGVRAVNSAITVAFGVIAMRPGWQSKPIGGLRQTAHGIMTIVGVILVISILIQRSPAALLAGMTASAAVLMLIFKDSILGFVSGIQLSANNMLKEGDWIEMSKYGADGSVEEVSLTTVKIRNFDNTIVTLPPYLLVSDSFRNWEGMRRSGGRRVMRSLMIDARTVRFCTPEMIGRLRRSALLSDYLDTHLPPVDTFLPATGAPVEGDSAAGSANSANSADPSADPTANPFDGRMPTNLGLFRAYIVARLKADKRINPSMTLMVRLLEPTPTGIPLQLYFFTDTVVWPEYEAIQSDVFDHLLAIISEFDLRIYQRSADNTR